MFPFLLTFVLAKEAGKKIVSGDWDSKIEDIFEIPHETEEDKKGTFDHIFNVLFHIQQILGSISSFLESIENVFNFSVPFLSFIALCAIILMSLILYIFPIRILIIIWGVNKITKKLIRPWATSNNEVLDFLSRVPDRVEMYIQQDISGK